MSSPDQPLCVVFGGPNGAGKSTIAEKILPALGITEFVNADVIAKGMSQEPDGDVQLEAGRQMLNRLEELGASRKNFAFESTLSSRMHAVRLKELKQKGYRIELFYVWLSNVELAVRRVHDRVLKGGHDIPEETVRRRYPRSLNNLFEIYAPIADSIEVFDNEDGSVFETIAMLSGEVAEVVNAAKWKELLNALDHC